MSSSEVSSNEENSSGNASNVDLYRCELCPNSEFTSPEMALHRQAHKHRRKSKSESMEVHASVCDVLSDVSFIRCRLCPSQLFTTAEKDIHRQIHAKRRNGPQETQENFNQSAPLNLELPLVFPGGQRGTMKLTIAVTLENGTPTPESDADAETEILSLSGLSQHSSITATTSKTGSSTSGRTRRKRPAATAHDNNLSAPGASTQQNTSLSTSARCNARKSRGKKQKRSA